MSERSYPYSTAHKHCVDLMEEVSNLEGGTPPQIMILLANAAKLLADESRKRQ